MYAYTVVLLESCIVDTQYLSSGDIELCFASKSCMQGFCFNLTLTHVNMQYRMYYAVVSITDTDMSSGGIGQYVRHKLWLCLK